MVFFLDPALEIEDILENINDLFAYKEMAASNMAECLGEARFSKVVDMGNEYRVSLFSKEVANVIWRQVDRFSKAGDTHFRPRPNETGKRNIYGPMCTTIFRELYK